MLFEDSPPGGNTTIVKSVAIDENCYTFSLLYTPSSPLPFFFFLWTRFLAWERPLLTAVFCAVAFVDIIYGGVTVSNSPSLIWILYILFGFRDPSEWSHALPVCLSYTDTPPGFPFSPLHNTVESHLCSGCALCIRPSFPGTTPSSELLYFFFLFSKLLHFIFSLTFLFKTFS